MKVALILNDQQLAGINRLSDLPQLKERAQEVLELLSRGEL
jgi:deoxyribodipyrimidine photolyase-related protein